MNQRTDLHRKAGAPQILALYIGAATIILTGIALAAVSFLSGMYFSVLGSPVHGAVFGTVVAFLGMRYWLSVRRLAGQVESDGSSFSLKNLFGQKQSQ